MKILTPFIEWFDAAVLRDAIQEETGYDVRELRVLSADGLLESPQQVYVAKGAWEKAAIQNGNAFTRAQEYDVLSEGVAPEQYGLRDYRGGIIVFSTDVNAVGAQGEGALGKLTAFAKNKIDTIKNRVFKNAKLSKLIQKHNVTNPDELFIGAFSIGKNFSGRYVSNGKVYDETSTSIDIGGVPSEVLLILGTEIAREFKQETVLIKDFNKNKFYLADRTEVKDAKGELSKV